MLNSTGRKARVVTAALATLAVSATGRAKVMSSTEAASQTGGATTRALRVTRRSSRAKARLAHYMRKAERYMSRKRYRKAIGAFQRALVYGRKARLFYSLGVCYEKLDKPFQALSSYRQCLEEGPKGSLLDAARKRVAALSLAIKNQAKRGKSRRPGSILRQWARATKYSSVRKAGGKKLVFAVDFSPSTAKLRKRGWRVFIQYLPKKRWILIFVTVLKSAARGGELPSRLIYGALHFNSVVPGAKLSIDKRTGNVDVQYEIPERFATVGLLDYTVHEVVTTADQLHDELCKLAKRGCRAGRDRGAPKKSR